MEKLLVIEWTAALLSMSGAMALSLKIKRISEVVAWPLWITSCILLTHFYSETEQDGLLVGQLVGLLSSCLGMIAWHAKDSKSVAALCSFCRVFAYSGTLLVLSALFIFAVTLRIDDLAWFGALASSTGAFVMAARSRYSQFAWIYWLVGDLIILSLAFLNGHMGVVTMSSFYTLFNFVGIYRWLVPQRGLAAVTA